MLLRLYFRAHFVALWGMFQLWDTTLDHDPRSIFFDNLTIVWADFKFYKWISSFISVVMYNKNLSEYKVAPVTLWYN